MSAWRVQTLPGKRETLYELGEYGGRSVVQARSDRSASLLRHQLNVQVDTSQRVRFSWQVPALIETADLRERDTEDSPVRLVLAFDGDHELLGERNRMLFDLAQTLTGERPPYATLMYVWDNHAPVGTVIPGARTDRIRKIVVDSGIDQLGRWLQHERNVVSDFRRAFGEDPGALIAVALMTDSDNTGTKASAWYGPVCFPGLNLTSPQQAAIQKP